MYRRGGKPSTVSTRQGTDRGQRIWVSSEKEVLGEDVCQEATVRVPYCREVSQSIPYKREALRSKLRMLLELLTYVTT